MSWPPTWTYTASQVLGGWLLIQNCQAPQSLGCCSTLNSLVAQTVKRLPTVWETGVQFLGQEDPLEKEMATHSNTFTWKILWTEESGTLQSMG